MTRDIDTAIGTTAQTTWLFRNSNTRASQFRGKILQLRQPVSHGQYRLRIVDVHAWRELQGRDRRRIDVDQPERGMIGHEMAAAALAVLAGAPPRPGGIVGVMRAFGGPHLLALPQREGVDGCGRPGAAGRAMAIAHGFRHAIHLDFHRAAEAFALVRSHLLLSLLGWRALEL